MVNSTPYCVFIRGIQMSRKPFGRGWKRRSRHTRRSDAVNPLRLVGGRDAPIQETPAYRAFVDAQAKVYTYRGNEDVSADPGLLEGA